MERRVALVTYDRLPGLAEDDRLLVPSLARHGIAAVPAIWSDPAEEWTRYDAVVLRSTWDYHRRVDEFLAWVDRIQAEGVILWNPPEVVRWNSDKRYLLDLERNGIAVVPTLLLGRGTEADLAQILRERGWNEAVVKPTVSASALNTWRASADQAPMLQPRFSDLIRDGDTLLQPFVHQIRSEGEWSLVFLGGELSHAVIKRPAPGDFRVQDTHGGVAAIAEPPARAVTAARRALAAAPVTCLYARVDGCMVDGEFRLMELELLEPQLFLGLHPPAAERLATAISARCSATPSRAHRQ